MKRAAKPMIYKMRTAEERQKARRGISLRGLGISQRTEQRYLSAVSRILPLLEEAESKEVLDNIVEDWIEAEWIKGTPLGTIGDALSGLHFYMPPVKGWLRGSWRLYKTWRRVEVPQRAPPMPRYICTALVGLFMELNEVTLAFLIALGFHAYLRTGELLKLQNQDIQCHKFEGVVTIRASKIGLRFNIDEAVSLYDETVLQLWELHLMSHRAPKALVWPHGAKKFREVFHQGLHCLYLDGCHFQPYSLRRGGATSHYAAKRSLDGILLRGRWRSLGVTCKMVWQTFTSLLCPHRPELRFNASPAAFLQRSWHEVFFPNAQSVIGVVDDRVPALVIQEEV